MIELPDHLGGHDNETHIDEGALDYLIKQLDIKSMIDVGCGPGGMVELAHQKGLKAIGVDGDFTCERDVDVIIHDYTICPFIPTHPFDLAWCVEFVEHVEPIYMQNFIATFKKCKYVMMTHATPDQGGHHHVNCRTTDFWIGALTAHGFTGLEHESICVRKASTMRKHYVRQVGLVFKNEYF